MSLVTRAAGGSDVNTLNLQSTGATVTGNLEVTKASRILGVDSDVDSIATVYNANSTITTNATNGLAALRGALKFDWYGNDWQIGNIRSSGTGSDGLGFALNGTNLRWRITNGTTYDYNALQVTGAISTGTTGTAISAPNGDISTGGVYRSGVYAPTANFSIASATSNVVYVNTVGLHLTIPSSGVTPGTVFHLCFQNSTVIDFSGLTLYNNGSTASSGSSWNGNSEYILTCASATAWYIK
jgi:hypothetical protein